MEKHRNNTIKFAQISDFHLLEHPNETMHGVSPYQRLEKVIQAIQQESYDFILATGDISNNAYQNSYEQLLQLTKNISEKIILIPGNHDRIDLLTKTFSLAENVLIAPPDPIMFNNWACIYVNTVIENNHSGYISQNDLHQLQKNLKQVSEFSVCLFMHHHPVDSDNPNIDQYKIKNVPDLIDSLTENVKLIVFGHTHLDFCVVKNGVIYSSCPSTNFQMSFDGISLDHYGYKKYLIAGENIFHRCVWITDDMATKHD